MAGPTSPGSEGPTFSPPPLPAGWIAQWDSASKKYYYVQLSTGVSQWDVPTEAAPTGGTPAPSGGDHPFGPPGHRELITHLDGSQTMRHADGTLEPVNPPMPPDGTRGLEGATGERGFGSMAMNALMGGKSSNHGSGSGLGHLAGQFLGGGHQGGSGGGGNSGLGKLGGALASSLLSSGGDKPDKPQNYHNSGQASGQSGGQQQNHGIAGSIMGGVAHIFGGAGKPQANTNYGYSNTGGSGGGGYTGSAPPTSYQPSGFSPASGSPSYTSSQPNQQSYQPPPSQLGHGHSYDHAPSHQSNQAYNHNVPVPQAAAPQSTYSSNTPYGSALHHANHEATSGGYNHQYGGGASGGHTGNQQSFPNGPPQHGQGGYGSHY